MPESVIYLEQAEDFDVVSHTVVTTTQVRKTADPISLGSEKARKALVSFWELSEREDQRRVEYHYLTTSSVASERDLTIDGLTGVEAWRVARTSTEVAKQLHGYLRSKFPAHTRFGKFLAKAAVVEVQNRLFQRFHWFTNQPTIDGVKKSVDARLRDLLVREQRPLRHLEAVRNALESRFWQVVTQESPTSRSLQLSDVQRLICEVAEVEIPTSRNQFHPLSNAINSERDLLDLYTWRHPVLPAPILRRPALTHRVEQLVHQRRVVLLTGTVFKGKTTLALLVASNLCPDARWVVLCERPPDMVDRLLMALAVEIDGARCPPLLVIDDLDLSPASHRIYRHALALVLHRANTAGIAVLITAQGATSASLVPQELENVNLVEVSELDLDEVATLCTEHGCSPTLSGVWSPLVRAGTGGHPALVRVRIAELQTRGWPAPTATDVLKPSLAVQNARDLARHLLRDTVPGPTAEFTYAVSEAHVPLTREVAMRLAGDIVGLTNPGDVIDGLAGKWLERVEHDAVRATALLRGAAADVWPLQKRRQIHIRLHDALIQKKPLSPPEAAALLFHAYLGNEPQRLMYVAAKLHLVKNVDARQEVERNLMWLTAIALDPEQRITDNAIAGGMLRGLQYRVAVTIHSENMEAICERWAEEIDEVLEAELQEAQRALMWFTISSEQSPRVPLRPRLAALLGIENLEGEISGLWNKGMEALLRDAEAVGIPSCATSAQTILLCATRCVRSVADLGVLIDWLESEAPNSIRHQLDEMLEWSAMQEAGAFVQGAWAAQHEQTTDWSPWLAIFQRIDAYAKAHCSPRIGREAAKANAIILTEYLSQPDLSEAVLLQAEIDFGPSAVLHEQWGNLQFQQGNYAGVLALWEKRDQTVSDFAWDPFARRRAGISAARLHRWMEAEQIFCEAARSISPNALPKTKFGLFFDAANAASRGGFHRAAIGHLSNGLVVLPEEAFAEGNAQWEAVIRAASTTTSDIERRLWKPSVVGSVLEPGYASTPGLEVPEVEQGQAARTALLQVRVLSLAATVDQLSPPFRELSARLSNSPFQVVRLFSVRALLSDSYATGGGIGFVDALFAFDHAISEMALNQDVRRALLPDQEGIGGMIVPKPERFLGLLVAAVMCAGPNVLAAIESWQTDAKRLLPSDAQFLCLLSQLSHGARGPIHSLLSVASDSERESVVRCGAAAQLLWNSNELDLGFQLQSFLCSALVGPDCVECQDLFSRHIARQLSPWWRERLANGKFDFSYPQRIPELEKFLDLVEIGDATLGAMRKATSRASGLALSPLDQFLL